MTKAFLDELVLKPENENLVVEAFSQESKKRVKAHLARKIDKSKKAARRKLSLNELFALN